MKILFLTYDLPYPLNSGGKIRAYNFIKSLSKNHQITLFSFYRWEEQKKYLPELKAFCHKVFLFKRRPVWCWQNLVKTFTSFLPFASATYYDPTLATALKKELQSNNYNLVHFESYYPALYLPLVKKLGVKTVMGNENLEYQIYERFANQKPCPLSEILKIEVLRMRIYEEGLWRQADLNVAASADDAQRIEQITGRVCPVIDNGVEVQKLAKTLFHTDGKTLLFVGNLKYQQNDDTIRYFLDKIYTRIRGRVRFILVSGHQPKWLDIYLADKNIEFIKDEFTPVEKFFSQADLLIVPNRIGGGTRLKIIQAMAAGLPVVTTTVGIQGIEATSGKEVMVADKPEDFANAVADLLKDSKKRQKLAAAAKKLAAEKYDWNKIGEKLNLVYRDFINDQ